MILDDFNSNLYFNNKIIHLTKLENRLMDFLIKNYNKKTNLNNIISYIFCVNENYKYYLQSTRNIIHRMNLKLKPYAKIDVIYAKGYYLKIEPSLKFLRWKEKFFKTHKREALLLKLYKKKEKIEKIIKRLEKNII